MAEGLRQIAITGGKGGVGKSTVAVLLANRLRQKGKRVILADCDIECPNDYLLLGQKLTESVKKVLARFPKLDKRKCRKCGLCVKSCRSNAIFQAPGQYPIFLEELCSGCGLCWHICPYGAIGVRKKIIGEIFQNRVGDNFYLVTGRSVGVLEESGSIVTGVKSFALELAKRTRADYLLFDTAVGLHCGVIRALMEVDLAYAVTEPTPLGAHDLRLILELLSLLKIKTRIVLNQSDLGAKEPITRIAEQNGVKIAWKLPYSRKLALSYARGKLAELNILR